MENVILSKLDFNKSWGELCNIIQETALTVLTPKESKSFLAAANSDAIECDGQDGVLLNGEYFDWRLFDNKKREIVSAFLRYFTPEQQNKIAEAM